MSSHFRWSWRRTIAVVILLIAVIQFYRVNRPADFESEPRKVFYTQPGTLIDGTITVPARDFLSYKIDLNRPARLIGKFWSGDKKIRVRCFIADQNNFLKWKSGELATYIADTGEVPSGQIGRKLAPGAYLLVLANIEDAPKTLQATFDIE